MKRYLVRFDIVSLSAVEAYLVDCWIVGLLDFEKTSEG